MAISVDPRRLGLLKQLAAEAGLRPGQLVQRWIEERLDAERSGAPVGGSAGSERLTRLEAAVAQLTNRIAALESRVEAGPAAGGTRSPVAPAHRRGRPRKDATTSSRRQRTGPAERVALHDEIIAVIAERGPSTAAELAAAIVERGRYHPPRSSRPLDAATVNSRVSNPIYRARFSRSGHRIGLAEGPAERAG
jgi:hypothetical protein